MKYAWWEIFKAKGVYAPGLAGGRIPGIRHVVSADGRKRRGGKRVRMDFALDLDMLNRHVDLHQAWEEHGGDKTAKFAIDKEEDEDGNWDGDDNNY